MYNNIALLIGHMVGDYLLQNNYLSVNKSKPGLFGAAICFLHSSIYALCVTTAVLLGGWRGSLSSHMSFSWAVAYLIVLVCHYPIDRWGLAGKWTKFFGQTQPDDLEHITLGELQPGYEDKGRLYVGLRQYFWAPVYICVDNTMHLVLMWILLSLLGS